MVPVKSRWPGNFMWGRKGPVFVELNLDMINRPHFSAIGDEDPHAATFALTWGNGNSDPVWLVQVRCRVPAFIGRRFEY